MSNRPAITEYLVVIAAFECLVAEEMYGGVINAIRTLRFGFDVLEAISLVPTSGEDVEGDHASY